MKEKRADRCSFPDALVLRPRLQIAPFRCDPAIMGDGTSADLLERGLRMIPDGPCHLVGTGL